MMEAKRLWFLAAVAFACINSLRMAMVTIIDPALLTILLSLCFVRDVLDRSTAVQSVH